MTANKSMRNIKTSQHCILIIIYIVTKNCKRSQSIATNTHTNACTHTYTTHTNTHTQSHTPYSLQLFKRQIDAGIKECRLLLVITNWNSKRIIKPARAVSLAVQITVRPNPRRSVA